MNNNYEPDQLRELKGLIGDRSDSIPGIKELFHKTSHRLIKKYKTLDNIYDNLDELDKDTKRILVSKKEIAYISLDVGTVARKKRK